MTSDAPTGTKSQFRNLELARAAGRRSQELRRQRLQAGDQPIPATPQPEHQRPTPRDAELQQFIANGIAAGLSLNPDEMRDADRLNYARAALELARKLDPALVPSDLAIREAYVAVPTCPRCGESLV